MFTARSRVMVGAVLIGVTSMVLAACGSAGGNTASPTGSGGTNAVNGGGPSGGGSTDAGAPIDYSTAESTSKEDFDALVKAAQDEGSLTWYGVPGESKIRAWVKPFEEKYNISVEIYRGTVTDVNKRFTEESTAGQEGADIVSMSVYDYIKAAAEKGWVANYTPENGPNAFVDDAVRGNAYPLYATVNSIVWNTNEVSDDQAAEIRKDGYLALGNDPELAGRVGIVAPTAGGMQLAADHAMVEDPNLGWDYFSKLLDAGSSLFESSVPLVANDLSSGEVAVATGIPGSVAIEAIYGGAPLQLMYPKITASGLHRMFVNANAPHPAAARLFMEWATSEDGQNGIAQSAAALIALKGWSDTREIVKQDWYVAPKSIDLSWESNFHGDAVDKFLNEWQSKFN